MPEMNQYFGFIFEDICRQYLLKVNHPKGKPFIAMGSWWGSDPQTKTQEEIDIVGETINEVIFGECKWTSKPISRDVLDALVRQSALVKTNNLPSYILFSRSGFSFEPGQAVQLIYLKDILSIVSK